MTPFLGQLDVNEPRKLTLQVVPLSDGIPQTLTSPQVSFLIT